MKLKQFRLSSNATLFLRIVIPTFWIVFFGLLIVAILLFDPEDNPFMNNPIVKYSLASGFLIFLFIMYRTIMQLKRVDADKEHLYVSNYFKTYRYKLHDIETIKEIDFGAFIIVRIVLKQKGAFGDTIPFLLNKPTFDDFIHHHPECGQYFVSK